MMPEDYKPPLSLYPGNIAIDVKEIILIYPLKVNDTSIRILTKTAGIVTIKEQDLHRHDKNVTIVGLWHRLVSELTDAGTDWDRTKSLSDDSKIVEKDGKLIWDEEH